MNKILYELKGKILMTVVAVLALLLSHTNCFASNTSMTQAQILNELQNAIVAGDVTTMLQVKLKILSIWRGNRTVIHWKKQRDQQFVTRIKSIEILQPHFNDSFDFELFPDKYYESQNYLYKLSLKPATKLSQIQKDQVHQYSEALRLKLSYSDYYRLQKNLITLESTLIKDFVYYLNQYIASHYTNNKKETFKLLLSLIDNSLTNPTVKQRLSNIIFAIQQDGYEQTYEKIRKAQSFRQ